MKRTVRIKAGQQEAAVKTMQEFIDQNCGRIELEYRMLNETLPRILETVGIEYLHTDYLKEWISGKEVPLPFP